MSNFLAIAATTATLSRTLQGAVGAEVPGATVTTVGPAEPRNGSAGTGVNIFLYQVTPNAAHRNSDLPTRNAAGRLLQRPRAALDLHYVLNFFGDEAQLEPQRLLGSVVRTLHSRPVLTRTMVRETVGDAAYSFLADSDLAEEVEQVKFTPAALSLEELSKLWSVFFQVPYTLSVAYQASVVLIEPEVTPRQALPVRERNVYAVPFRRPTIERVRGQAGQGEPMLDQPILAGYRLTIEGRQLRGEDTRIRLGGVEVEPLEIEESRIVVALPESLRAGVQGVQVLHLMPLGTPPEPHRGFESNVAAFVLRPSITVAVDNVEGDGEEPRNADVTVEIEPSIKRDQRIVLLLDEHDPPADRPPRSYSFAGPPRGEDEPEESGSMRIRPNRVQPGTYLARLQVDGAESMLRYNEESGSYDEPRVTIS